MLKSTARKRKAPSAGPSGLQRRVRARKEEVDSEIDESSNPSENEGSEQSSDEDEDDEESKASRPSKSNLDMASISFGALAKAQASMPKRSKKESAESEESEIDDSGSDSGNESKYRKRGGLAKRSSKHAPTEMSSKRPVSRKREIFQVPKVEARDPRFDPAVNSGGSNFDEAKAKKAYAFLDEYRDSEMAELRMEIRKTKDAAQKERLQTLLQSMQNRKKAAKRKDDEKRILEEHRQREKDLVQQGKQPFYLKKSEQKKRLLTEQFKGMKKKQVNKVIERKRKKVAAKEKMELDQLQRR
ncbi:rRNA biogenesis protein RRP36 like [Verticillium longisporum]|uniref:rRNA biogenesis protein RRP36 n=1 Tax=Verticillium longisporum TaxID=100787 RepID=A0A0G4MMY7_VERLO|nr:rRNA biogenesis protein RRP36 like [Verticillium longisporum]KAG7148843.1 rRNA biogenesis protein RRP36 like [Verticillium longisporum]CRK17000.1 hypothetical protein BN1723_011186 [Verticillium longisporum]CRK35668.1 hypothetical protein BN1708_001300 [Verticillium longisporum]